MAANTGLFAGDRGDLIRGFRREGVRHVLDGTGWARLATEQPPRAHATPLLALWGDATGHVHALFADQRLRPLIATVATEAGRYLALSETMPIAAPYERVIRDLWGFEAMHARDLRPMLDHGCWTATAPLASRPGPPPRGPEAPEFQPDDTPGLALIETGPIGALDGLLRTRVTLGLAPHRAAIGRVEMQTGFGHRGLAACAQGRTLADAAKLIERLSAGAIVAHGLAFARAAEAALDLTVPPRAAILRDAALELERAISFLDRLALIAREAGAERLASRSAALRAELRLAADGAFGHRMIAGFVVPGGVSREIGADAVALLTEAAGTVGRAMPALARLYEANLADRLTCIGTVTPAAAGRIAASGIVGRASGQSFDARRAARPWHDAIELSSPVGERGCADQRTRLRLVGIASAATRLTRLLAALQDGPIAVALPSGVGRVQTGGAQTGGVQTGEPVEGVGIAEAPEGEVWHVLRIDADMRVATIFARDPSLGHTLLLDDASRNAALHDAALIRLSFGFSPEALDQ